MRLRKIASLAILLWLSYGITLGTLPPQEAAPQLAPLKQMLTDPPPWTKPEWATRPQAEQEFSRQLYYQAMRDAQDLANRPDQLEKRLWIEWAGNACLVFAGILGWLLVLMSKRSWKPVVFASTAALVIGQTISHWVVYSELVRSWAGGFSGVKYLAWPVVLPMLYLLFVLPVMLIALTAIAFTHGSRARSERIANA